MLQEGLVHDPCPRVMINLSGRMVPMLFDTGEPISVIGYNGYQSIWPGEMIENEGIRIRQFNGTLLAAMRRVEIVATLEERFEILDLWVIDWNIEAVLGWDWITRIGPWYRFWGVFSWWGIFVPITTEEYDVMTLRENVLSGIKTMFKEETRENISRSETRSDNLRSKTNRNNSRSDNLRSETNQNNSRGDNSRSEIRRNNSRRETKSDNLRTKQGKLFEE
ncbi:unnamed protein product [Gordionus sp. m RMFG-2023]